MSTRTEESIIERNSLIVLQEQILYPVQSFLEARVSAAQVLIYSIKKKYQVVHRAGHEITRKASVNVSNIIIMHRFHVVPLPFTFLVLPEGAVATYWHSFVHNSCSTLLLVELERCRCCCSLTLTHRYNAVRGHITGSNNPGAEDYLRRKTNKTVDNTCTSSTNALR